MEKKKTVVTTIRLPIELHTRIELLAAKRLCSKNAWCVNALAIMAKPKPKKCANGKDGKSYIDSGFISPPASL